MIRDYFSAFLMLFFNTFQMIKYSLIILVVLGAVNPIILCLPAELSPCINKKCYILIHNYVPMYKNMLQNNIGILIMVFVFFLNLKSRSKFIG